MSGFMTTYTCSGRSRHVWKLVYPDFKVILPILELISSPLFTYLRHILENDESYKMTMTMRFTIIRSRIVTDKIL